MLCTQEEFDAAVAAYITSTLPSQPFSIGARIELGLALVATSLSLLPDDDNREVREQIAERMAGRLPVFNGATTPALPGKAGASRAA